MPVVSLTSVKPQVPSTLTPFRPPTTTPLPSREVPHMEAHAIVIVVIFCVVCFLLLLAFFYAFCFQCSIGPSRKESRAATSCSLDPEDATYKCSSSDNRSAQNAV